MPSGNVLTGNRLSTQRTGRGTVLNFHRTPERHQPHHQNNLQRADHPRLLEDFVDPAGSSQLLCTLSIKGNEIEREKMAGGPGFEPGLAESESAVLPLDDPPVVVGF